MSHSAKDPFFILRSVKKKIHVFNTLLNFRSRLNGDKQLSSPAISLWNFIYA